MFIVMLDIWVDGDTLKVVSGDVFADYNDALAAARAVTTVYDGNYGWGWSGNDGWVALVTPTSITALV